MTEQDNQELQQLYQEMTVLRETVHQKGSGLYQKWEKKIQREAFKKSAENLAYYIALRSQDVRDLQEKLSHWGLSSLGRAESKVMSQIDRITRNLALMTHTITSIDDYPYETAHTIGRHYLNQVSEEVLGKVPASRQTRIMVTLPTEAAVNRDLLVKLLEEGMDVARINCGHDSWQTWEKMVHNIRLAEKQTGKACKIYFDIAGPKVRIKGLYTTDDLKLKKGSTFFLTSKDLLRSYEDCTVVIQCSSEEHVQHAKMNQNIVFDDGILEGRVISVHPEGVVVEVTKVAKEDGIKLKVQKGINFPDATIKLPILTEKDLSDLDNIFSLADILGFSFIQDVEDIRAIQKLLKKRYGDSAKEVPVVIKIETIEAVNRLPEIIIEAAGQNPVGIMLARGDLAVETGFLRLSELQPEILSICEAAHIPVIWSTQVLENLVKKGMPTRAEITDATMGGQAECVMLNKGTYIVEGVALLDDILKKQKEIQDKKTARLRSLSIAKRLKKS